MIIKTRKMFRVAGRRFFDTSSEIPQIGPLLWYVVSKIRTFRSTAMHLSICLYMHL